MSLTRAVRQALRLAVHDAVAATLTERRCAGCGGELSRRLPGCDTCWSRFKRRQDVRGRTDERRRAYYEGRAPVGYRPRYGRYRVEERKTA